MPFTNYGNTNNAQGQLQAGIGASATSAILQTGQGALFPSNAQCPFFVKTEQYDTPANGYRVLKREIMKVTGRAGDTLTWTRSAGTCPPDYATLTPGTTAFAFNAGDTITQVLTAEQINEIETNKVSVDSYQNQTPVYAPDVGTANAYSITLTPAITAYTIGQCFTFKALNTNTGASTINVNGLGVKTIKKNVSSDLSSGDITAGAIVIVEYDGTNFQITSSLPPTIPVDSFMLGEGCAAGDALTTEKIPFPLAATISINFGNATATQYQGFRMVGNGQLMSSISVNLKKILAPADNCILAIQADSAGSPSGTDLATATIAGGTITTSNAEYTPSLSGSITPTDGAYYWVVCRRSGALDASNYYQINAVNETTVAFPNKTNNAGAWGSNTLTSTPTITGNGFYSELAVRANATTRKFANIKLYSPSALSALARVSKSISDIYSGLSALKIGRTYYLSNTSGVISLTQGTVKSYAGEAKSGTTMLLPKRIVGNTKLTSTDSTTATSLTAGTTYFTNVGGFLELRIYYNFYFPMYSRIEYSPDNVTWTTLGEILLPSANSGGTGYGTSVSAYIEQGFYRVQHNSGSASGTLTSYTDLYEYVNL